MGGVQSLFPVQPRVRVVAALQSHATSKSISCGCAFPLLLRECARQCPALRLLSLSLIKSRGLSSFASRDGSPCRRSGSFKLRLRNSTPRYKQNEDYSPRDRITILPFWHFNPVYFLLVKADRSHDRPATGHDISHIMNPLSIT